MRRSVTLSTRNIDLFKIADLAKLTVVAFVNQSDIPEFKALPPGRRRWTIHPARRPDTPGIEAYFDSIGDEIDPRTGTFKLIGTVDNDKGDLLVGQAILLTIVDPSLNPSQLAIPLAAIVKKGPDSGKVWVEVDDAKAKFEWREVQFGGDQNGETVICYPVQPAADKANPKPDIKLLRSGARVVVWGDPQETPPATPAAPQRPAGPGEDQGSEMLRELRRQTGPLLAAMAREHGYGLAASQNLRRVPPPFPETRMQYYRAANPSQAKAIPAGPDGMVFRTNNDLLTPWGMTFCDSKDQGYALSGLLDFLLGIKSQMIEGPPELLRNENPWRLGHSCRVEPGAGDRRIGRHFARRAFAADPA